MTLSRENTAATSVGGAHVCQLHHDESTLSRNVACFVKEGLDAGSAVIVVAGDRRQHDLREFLAKTATDASTPRLTVIDSSALLQRFMRDGAPDRRLFRDALCPVLRIAAASGNGALCVYGEMVNDLWRNGDPQSAITLERYWNELLQEYRFSLFCGYVLDAFDSRSYGPHLEAVCRLHSQVAPAPDEDDVRIAVDEACHRVLGVHLSSLLRHSQLADGKWHVRLPLSRRAVLWLKSNTASRFTHVMHIARDSYAHRVDSAAGR